MFGGKKTKKPKGQRTGILRIFGTKAKPGKKTSVEVPQKQTKKSIKGPAKSLLGKLKGRKKSKSETISSPAEVDIRKVKTLKMKKKGKKPKFKKAPLAKPPSQEETPKPALVKREKSGFYPGVVNFKLITPEETWVPGITADVAKFSLDNNVRIFKFKDEL